MGCRYRKALFIFRRDLRLHDNSALIAALRQADSVLTVFIADEHLLKPARHFANHFLANSIKSLQHDIQRQGGELCLQAGDVMACIEAWVSKEGIDAVFINRDYTPYAQARDDRLKRWCEQGAIGFHVYADQLLVEPEQALKKDGTPYTVFTPFYRNAVQFAIAKPKACPDRGFARPDHIQSLSVADVIPLGRDNAAVSNPVVSNPEVILANMHTFSAYQEERNFPALDKTTRLSVHLKFGRCSVRDVYHRVKKTQGLDHELIRALFWRDFFTHIAWHFPYVFKQAFRQKYQTLHWPGTQANFVAWCEGRTGFPIVDAGMRELNATGFMHNRVRMITASFLIKDLHIDWKSGEAYFRNKLLDYDACVNNGNWQWVASTGCDAQPWFRIFNPWAQQKKFDPECVYIKKWIPELRPLAIAEIHSPARSPLRGYPAPLVDHKTAVSILDTIYKTTKPICL